MPGSVPSCFHRFRYSTESHRPFVQGSSADPCISVCYLPLLNHSCCCYWSPSWGRLWVCVPWWHTSTVVLRSSFHAHDCQTRKSWKALPRLPLSPQLWQELPKGFLTSASFLLVGLAHGTLLPLFSSDLNPHSVLQWFFWVILEAMMCSQTSFRSHSTSQVYSSSCFQHVFCFFVWPLNTILCLKVWRPE